MTDFLIQFGSNASLVIAQMRQLEAQALRTQQVINQTSAASARTAAAGGGALGGLTPAAVGAVTPQVERLTKSLGGLQSQMRALGSLGIAPTLGQTRREMQLLQQITAAGGPSFGRYNSGASAAAASLGVLNPAAARSAQELIGQRAALDTTTQAFQRHVGRIQETILVYAALAAAAAGVANAVSLASTIDTESRRLEAVLDLNPAQGRQLVSGIGQVAISTATPLEDLLSESDLVASAFAGVTDEAEKQRLALALLNDVGKITTVTQRDVATETQNLIAIMQLGGLSVEGLGVALGQVTTAGNNSSTSIAAILDALNIAIPGAKLAGVTIEQLIALTGLFRAETQRSGSEIGNTFKTLFQTITQPEAENNISDLTDGMVELRDEAGNLRPALEILLEIKTLINSGAIDPGKLNDIFKAFAPPLNPGAAKDIAIIFDLLDELPAALREVEQTGSSALDGLVDKLNAALGPQFRILIEELKLGFFELFGDDIINSGQTLIDLIRSLGDIIGSLDPDLVRFVGSMIALGVAFKGAAFVAGALFTLMGVGGITGALKGAETAAFNAGRGFGFMSSVAVGLQVVLARVLPLLLAIAAIDLAQQVGTQQGALRGQIGGLATGLDREGLLALRGRLESQMPSTDFFESASRGPGGLFEDSLANLTVAPALQEGIDEINRLLEELEGRGANATVGMDDLGEGFTGAGDASQEVTDAIAEQAAELERLIAGYQEGAAGAAGMTNAQTNAAKAAELLTGLVDEQANAYLELDAAVQAGDISLEEHAEGVQRIAQASEQATQLVALHGEALGQIPQLAGAAAAGEEQMTAALFNMILGAQSNGVAIDSVIQRLLGLGAAHARVADFVSQNPIIIRMITQVESFTSLPGIFGGTFRALQDRLRQAGANNAFHLATSFGGGGAQSQFNDLVSQLSGLFTSGTSPIFNPGSGSSGGSTAAPRVAQPNLLDIGDFDPARLAEAIALAQRLQSSIPGANDAAVDEVLNIIADAQFLQQTQGLDDELLRKAIERLTDIEEARLALERERAPLLANLVVNQGGLSSLITQPASFGTDGSFLGGTGFNSDPSRQSVVVNIGTISGQALTAPQISALMYDAISRAFADAAKL